jgi:hypothetical protein
MNERIRQLAEQATSPPHRSQGYGGEPTHIYPGTLDPEKFARLLVSDVLREVDTRAYVSGDRAWSDELDRPWIELEYGFGKLADAQRQAEKIK